MTVSDQLSRELTARLARAELVGPELANQTARRIEQMADHWAAVLSHGGREAVELTRDLMVTLWPHASPEDVGRADWWTSPLGRGCAAHLADVDEESVTHAVAAAMLGISRGAVGTMVHRGTLARHPDGGVMRSAVLARISR